MVTVEVCCQSVEDVLIAEKFPIQRIELNSALSLGGLTPTLATLILAKERTDVPLICMVRNRGGHFLYTPLEIETMYADASLMLENGADGIAFGFVTEDQKVDTYLTTVFTKLAHSFGKEAIFHRAFDTLKDPLDSLSELNRIGINRILTSGNKKSALEGAQQLKQMTQLNTVEIMAGSGITPENVIELIAETNVQHIHGSFSEPVSDLPFESEVSYHLNQTKTSRVKLEKLFNQLNSVE